MALEISIVFILSVYLQIEVSENSSISKHVRKYKPPKVKNGDNLVDKKLLLFTSNSTIGDLHAQSS